MLKPIFAIVWAATLAGVAGADAQVYPSRPITMVVPYSAGARPIPSPDHGRAHAGPARPDHHR